VIIEYTKTRDSAHSPQRANPSDAGLDVFYSATEPQEIIAVHPNQSMLVPTGLRFGVPHGYMLEVKNRSSVAAKLNLVVGACVIDSGYDGEVFINVHNIGRDSRVIQDGDKIAQLVMMPVVHFQPQENTEGTLYDYPKTISNRGTGALGSTDVA
jgi:dUTP pyrophosphatase